MITGLIAPRDEAQCRTDFPAHAEAIGVFKCKDEGEGSERAHAADLTEQPGLRVAFAAELFVRLVIGFDLLGEGDDGVDDGCQSGSKGLGDVRSDFVSEAISGAGRQTSTGALHDAASMVDE